jgi:hypothetical protein
MTSALETEWSADPGNRQQRRARRARVSRFGRGRGTLETALLSAYEINLHPRADLFRNAATYWRANGRTTCFVCRAPAPHAAAFLFGWSGKAPSSAAVASLCESCWRTGNEAAIDAGATRVLQQVAPRGRFLDPREVAL